MRKIVYKKAKTKRKLLQIKILSLVLMSGGFLLILLALWPIISFNIMIAPRFMGMIKPVPEDPFVNSAQKKGFSVSLFSKDDEIVRAQESENIRSGEDFTKANIWFPDKPALKISQENALIYALSIPKLKIYDAVVNSASVDLNKSLIHYGDTAYPGDYGNTVIFGHSVLPYFYNPKDYKTIFSTLPSLKEGDEIFINYEGISYRYVVEEMRVVKPDDISILEQRYDDSYLSLITCVPPGTYESRLWVKSKLEKI